MHVVLIGRYQAPYPFSEHRLDYPMLKVWAEHLGVLDVIVQSQDNTARTWQEGGLVVHYIPASAGPLRSHFFVGRAARLLMSIHKRDQVDIVNGSDLLGGLVGILLRSVINARVIVQLQDEFLCPNPLLFSPPKRLLLRKLALFLSRRADLVRCLYDKATQELVTEGVAPQKIVTIPSRCDVHAFDPRVFPRTNPNGSNILFVGSLVRRKGGDYLLQAMPEIIRKHPEARLLMVGKGPAQTELEQLTRSLGIEDHVDFLGFIPHDRIPQLMRNADMFVLPSLSEATPRVLMEAMAMELPVVATRVGGIPEMVEHGRTGLLVQPGSVKELAEAIRWVLDNPYWRKKAGKLGRERVVKTYALELIQQQQIEMHFRVLNTLEGSAK